PDSRPWRTCLETGEAGRQGGNLRRRQLVPGSDDVAADRTELPKGFIIVELEMAVEIHRRRNAGAGKVVIGAAPAAVHREGGARGVDRSDKGGIATNTQAGVAWQAIIHKVVRIAVGIDHALAIDIRGRPAHIQFEAGPWGNL